MNEATTLQQAASACLPVVGLLIAIAVVYIAKLFHKGTEQTQQELDNATAEKYTTMARDTVLQVVTATAQTFVDALKAEGVFTKEKQLEAFNTAKLKVLAILGETAVKALRQIYGDFDAWLDTKIEQACREIKPSEDAAKTAASVAAAVASTAVQQVVTAEPTATEE